jgi:hypothetical protein
MRIIFMYCSLYTLLYISLDIFKERSRCVIVLEYCHMVVYGYHYFSIYIHKSVMIAENDTLKIAQHQCFIRYIMHDDISHWLDRVTIVIVNTAAVWRYAGAPTLEMVGTLMGWRAAS